MQIENQLKSSLTLLDSLKAITFGKGIALSILTGVAVFVSYFLLSMVVFKFESIAVALIFALIPLAIAFYGFNAVGILNFQEAKGQSVSIGQAVSKSLSSMHRLILLFLLVVLATIVLMVAGTVLMYFCKIPGIGPILYGLMYPVGVVLFGFYSMFLMFVFMPLAAPSIWSGNGTVKAFKSLIVMAKKNMVVIAIKTFLLSLIVGGTSMFISVLFGSGTMYMTALSSTVLYRVDFVFMLFQRMLNSLMYGNSPFSIFYDLITSLLNNSNVEYITAQAFGHGVLVILAMSMASQVVARGFSLIYLSSKDDSVDVEQEFKDLKVPEGFKDSFEKAKVVAGDLASKAKVVAQEAAVQAKEKADELAKKAAEAKAAHDEKVRLKEAEAKRIAEEERALERERLALERQKEARLAKEQEEILKNKPKEELKVTVTCKNCGHECSTQDKFCEECGADL